MEVFAKQPIFSHDAYSAFQFFSLTGQFFKIVIYASLVSTSQNRKFKIESSFDKFLHNLF